VAGRFRSPARRAGTPRCLGSLVGARNPRSSALRRVDAAASMGTAV